MSYRIFTATRTTAAVALLGLAGLAAPASAQQCPDWSLGGTPVATDGETAWVPQSYPVFAGGAVDLSGCQQNFQGFGYVTAAPSFTFQYDERGTQRDLEFRVQSECDTVLIINDQSGAWHYNDDDSTAGVLTSRLRLPVAPSGQYDVWVGTYGQQACQATLIAETFPSNSEGAGGGGGSAGLTCPDWSLGGAEVQLSAGSTTQQPASAGGPLDMFTSANSCGFQGHGYMTQAPNFTVYYDQGANSPEMVISATSDCDTVLLVNNQAGEWLFNDDTNALNPQINIPAAASGRYDVWVGSFSQNSTCNASVVFSAGGAAGGGAASK